MYQRTNFPALTSEHLRDAKLFATRDDLVKSFSLPAGPNICEVGVALGGFSRVLLDAFEPGRFYALDLFELHHQKLLWGQPTSEIFEGGTHLDYYKRKFPQATVIGGRSAECMSRLPDNYFDLIYVDAAHDYENVKKDAQQAVRLLKKGGVIVFNDYIMFDHIQGAEYGVVQVVNELLAAGGWKVIGLGLQQHLFNDIAISAS
jgi:hypothetical protein